MQINRRCFVAIAGLSMLPLAGCTSEEGERPQSNDGVEGGSSGEIEQTDRPQQNDEPESNEPESTPVQAECYRNAGCTENAVITYYEHGWTSYDSPQVVGRVKNVSDRELSLWITAEWYDGEVRVEDSYDIINDLAPGTEAKFEVIGFGVDQGEADGFKVYVERTI